jgi:DNA-binding IclR family transcriptional regulator
LLNETTILKKATPETVVDLSKLRDILEDVRRLGYAVERDETDIGVTCISAPIFMAKQVIGAISLSAPSVRLRGESENNAIRAVKKASATITATLSRS